MQLCIGSGVQIRLLHLSCQGCLHCIFAIEGTLLLRNSLGMDLSFHSFLPSSLLAFTCGSLLGLSSGILTTAKHGAAGLEAHLFIIISRSSERKLAIYLYRDPV